ncbi:phage integrase Arm DNA-binding domain-containing protein, partial [Escherichia coli]|uniref:phage integrase Arm DNA-binding domain-containing protein n=1 Tax=Escherichia coli TaxID=562 RepID=UPI00385027C3
MGRRRSHERRDLPPNLYIRNNGYYCYRDPRTGKEFGLGRDRRIAITEAIQANIELFSGHKHKPLTARINSDNSVTLHSWLDRYEKILASRGIKQKTLINYMSKIKAIRRGLPDAPLEDITTKEIAAMLNGYIDEGKAGLLYTSDAADDSFHPLLRLRGGIIKKKITERVETRIKTDK